MPGAACTGTARVCTHPTGAAYAGSHAEQARECAGRLLARVGDGWEDRIPSSAAFGEGRQTKRLCRCTSGHNYSSKRAPIRAPLTSSVRHHSLQHRQRMTLSSPNSLNSDALARLVATRAWVHGWAISRNAHAPIERSGYFRIFVGKPEQMMRYVLPNFDCELIQSLVSSESGPGTWLKVCAPIDSVRPLLSDNWHVHEPEFLMSAKLANGDASIIPGYRVHTDGSDTLMFARIFAETGELAASGQVAIKDSFASFDQIVTAEAHRRRGLGRCVMTMLTGASLDHGARQGVLVATEAGAALYKALGWSVISPVTAASHLGAQELENTATIGAFP